MAHSVVISGSYRKHFSRIWQCRQEFEQAGVNVLRPATDEVLVESGTMVRLAGDPETVEGIEAAQLTAISSSELLYVVNPGGYLGPATTLEIGYAHRAGLPIITSEVPYEAAVAAVISGVGSPENAIDLLERNGR